MWRAAKGSEVNACTCSRVNGSAGVREMEVELCRVRGLDMAAPRWRCLCDSLLIYFILFSLSGFVDVHTYSECRRS
jgi:hypothetical protein